MFDDPKKAASRARHAAMDAATEIITAWHDAEKAKITADTTLNDAERRAKKYELMLEVGKRAKRAEAKARRDNTAGKVLEREAMGRHRDRRID
ncbi:hypothetical protein B0I12_002956 [Microbacterium hydrothermale]|uniref:hypothetical protein n=1 Tax=Microbacterium hydrothermale TaxID=857427 RepID=UPI002227CF54|nr:hypothetical protein [Microbacterium hydrothermale]MCW2165791.1 hypothetical protein [Microbacterium hydrothermale]